MRNATKVILGVDPGTARMGWGVINYDNNNSSCIEYGVIETPAGLPDAERLGMVHKEFTKLLKTYKPDAVAVEDIFYFKNQKTLIQVSQARGLVLGLAAIYEKPCFSFTPLQVKQAVTGYGRAEKRQVQQMVKTLLGFTEIPEPDDAADALAVAICHAHST